LPKDTKVLEENLPSATLSTTNPTRSEPGSNQVRHGRKPATSYLNYGLATLPVAITFFTAEDKEGH
jgi:hypothetical protein